MMTQTLFMPKATAVWLIDNTSLTFKQIADFCRLHELEVEGIANDDVAQGIKGLDPIGAGQLTREEIAEGEKDAKYTLKLVESKHNVALPKRRRVPRYTPLSRRRDRPDAIAWLVRNHADLSDAQITKLVGTTKPTIKAIRDRSYWNMSALQPVDPVSLGLCTQIELDKAVGKAYPASKAKSAAKSAETPEAPKVSEIVEMPESRESSETPKTPETSDVPDADSVFSTPAPVEE